MSLHPCAARWHSSAATGLACTSCQLQQTVPVSLAAAAAAATAATAATWVLSYAASAALGVSDVQCWTLWGLVEMASGQ